METATINDLVEEIRDEVVGWRRHLHRNPELSYEERETSRFVYETLEAFGGASLELSRPTPTSVLARLVGERPGRTVALRADMDALPIAEENEHEFLSENPGVMHACGHDGHTAMLLGAAKVLASPGMKEDLEGEVLFVFQHAEEVNYGGAEDLVEAGVMEGVDAVFGMHLSGRVPTGTLSIAPGPRSAAPDTFEIVVEGNGGHAARPQATVDAIVVGAQVVTNLQHVVAREVDPLESVVVSVTQFTGGTANNIIPGRVELEGTVRTLNEETRGQVPKAIERIVKGITAAHGASCSFSYRRGPDPVVNDEGVTRAVEETAGEVFGEDALVALPPNMGAEDFSAYQRVTPGAFLIVGAGNEEKGTTYPNHHPRFDVDEDALEIGVKMHVHTALRLLGRGA